MSGDLNEMLVFARVVQAGSFTAAAAALGMPKSTVSRKVAELEERLDARLLQRTTRKLSLTDVGRTYYEYCARIAADVDDAERAVSDLQGTPRGLLRVTAPINVAFLGPIVSDYLERYPEVQLDLFCTGRAVDLVEERYDIGIRAGSLADSSLVARSLGRVSWFLVATPAYLKRRGSPKSPDDLAQHDLLFFGSGSMSVALRLERGDSAAQLHIPARLLVSDMDILRSVVTAGQGIALLPAFLCVADLRARVLDRVLREWTAPATPVQVVYPSTRHISPKVKSFVEHLQQRMTPPPWELGPMP
jgi:DNA-binding transcriptional LysR family regulator